jgi:hypothetical protein
MKYQEKKVRRIPLFPWNNEMCVTPPGSIGRAKSAAISDKGKPTERWRRKVTGLKSRPNLGHSMTAGPPESKSDSYRATSIQGAGVPMRTEVANG